MINKIFSHYYGDTIRILFLSAGFIMLITLPYFNDILSQPLTLSMIIIFGLGLLAGFTSPMQKWVSIINTLIAALATIIFEYYAVNTDFSNLTSKLFLFFLTNQLFALIFFLALYYSIKTLRGHLFEKEK